jgi:hypothetical protein
VANAWLPSFASAGGGVALPMEEKGQVEQHGQGAMSCPDTLQFCQ